MSTKIYNGFKFKKNYSLFEIKQIAAKFRAIIQPIIKKKVNTFIANAAVAQIDKQILFGTKCASFPLMAAIDEFAERERQIKLTNRRDPVADMEFNVCILPAENELYGIVYTEQNELLNLWMNQEEIVAYPYWNNTDRPDDIEQEDWEKRGEEWDAALSDYHAVPSMNGMTIEFVNSFGHGFPSVEEVLDCIPTFELRCRYWVKELVLDHAETQIESTEGSPYRRYSAAKKWLETAAGKECIAKTELEMRGRLPVTITKEMLLARDKDE